MSTSAPPRRLALADVVQAGVALTRTSGLGSLTLAAVARELGVQSPSLYHHVPGGLDELKGHVVDHVIAAFEAVQQHRATDSDSPWDRLERPLRDAGRLVREYPGVLQYVLTLGRNRPQALASAAQTVKLLLDSELGPVAPAAWLLINTYVTGWAFATRPDSRAARDNGWPQLAEVLTVGEALSEDEILFSGLRSLLAGLLVTSQGVEGGVGTAAADRHAVARFLR
jgi:AcrR family transcriptional regulator